MDIWKHGKYVDLWSVVHLLSGLMLCLGLFSLGYGFWSALVISLLLLIAWEGFEWLVGIIEPSPNVGVDLVIGFAGFLIGAFWHYTLGMEFSVELFWGVAAATGVLALWGFLDFYLHGYR
jgi:hypothetical protein